MDRNRALELVRDWGRAEREDTSLLQPATKGSFVVRVASVGFEYDGVSQTLIVRATVLPWASSLLRSDDIMQELKRIALEEPDRVDNADFELWQGPWDSGEVALYLRQQHRDSSVSSAIAIATWRKLRETAYLWRRTRYLKAIDPVVRRRPRRVP